MAVTFRQLRRFTAVSLEIGGKLWAKVVSQKKQAPTLRQTVSKDSLNNKVVVITGSTRGIGRAAAAAFADAGARPVIVGTRQQDVEKTAAEIGRGSIGIVADITSISAVKKLMEQVVDTLGNVDILINNAGITGRLDTSVSSLDYEDLDKVLDVNLKGAFYCIKAVLPFMEAAGSGRIINVSSGGTEGPAANMLPYGVSKFALEGLTRQVACDLENTGVVISTIRFGSVQTDMTEKALGWSKAAMLQEPDEVADIFLKIATAPSELIQGRAIAAWRFMENPEAELRSQAPMSMTPSFSYPVYVEDGEAVKRGSDEFRFYDRAENSWGPSPKVLEALEQAIKNYPLAVYPDDSHRPLRAALSSFYGLPEDHFAIGNGSWELLDRLLELFTHPGDEVVSSRPGWFGFSMLCKKRGLQNVRVPFATTSGNRTGHNLKEVARKVTTQTRLIYLISPSNPEGVVLKRAEFDQFLEDIPKNVLIIVDEAYIEYADDPDCVSAMEYIKGMDRPIIGLRTFSKFYALASMRVGYAYGKPELLDLLNRGERIFNIAHLSEIAAVAALEDREYADFIRSQTFSERKKMEKELEKMSLSYMVSDAPYILVELPGDLKQVVEAYRKHKIFVGEKSFYKQKYFMLPVATPDENIENLHILKSLT